MGVNMNMDMGKMQEQLYKRLDGVVYDLQAGVLGFYNKEGNLATLKKAKNGRYVLENNPFDMNIAAPAFALRSKVEDLVAGDIVYNPSTGDLGFFLKTVAAEEGEGSLDNVAISIVKADGSKGTIAIAENPVLGAGVMAAKSLFNAGMDSALPMLMMLNNGYSNNGDLGKFLALSAMTGQNLFAGLSGDNSGMNPMMLMALMNDGNNGGKMDVKQLMLMSMLSGQETGGGINPMMLMALGEGKMDKKMMLMMAMSGGFGQTETPAKAKKGDKTAGGGNANMMQMMLMLDLFRS